MGWGESGFTCCGVKGPTLVLFLFYVNVSGMKTRSPLSSHPMTIPIPWVTLRVRWTIPMVSTLLTASHFLPGSREAKLKPTTFFSLLLFCFPIFPLFLIRSSDTQRYITLSVACWDYSLLIIYIYMGWEEYDLIVGGSWYSCFM